MFVMPISPLFIGELQKGQFISNEARGLELNVGDYDELAERQAQLTRMGAQALE